MVFPGQLVLPLGDDDVEALPLHLCVVPLLAPLDRALHELQELGFA